MTRARLTLPVALALVGALGVPARATHSWNGYHWARGDASIPVSLRLLDKMNGVWDTLHPAVSSDWGALSPVFAFTTVSGKRVAYEVELASKKFGNNGWLGLATIWIDGSGHIVRGRVQVNDYYFQFPRYNTPEVRQHVLCQELGHVLGLDHNRAGDEGGSPDDSCMNDRVTFPTEVYPHPNVHDAEQIGLVYGHADGGGSALSTAKAGHREVTVHVFPADKQRAER